MSKFNHMQNLKKLLLLSACIVGMTLCVNPVFGQKAYSFKPWKGKHKIPTKNVIFAIDTLGSEESYQAIERITSELSSNLSKNGIRCTTIRMENIQPTDKDGNSLFFMMSLIKPAYVKLNTIGPKIPLCNRIVMKQDNFLAPNPKHRIETIISISIDKNDEAIQPLGEELANKILVHLASARD